MRHQILPQVRPEEAQLQAMEIRKMQSLLMKYQLSNVELSATAEIGKSWTTIFSNVRYTQGFQTHQSTRKICAISIRRREMVGLMQKLRLFYSKHYSTLCLHAILTSTPFEKLLLSKLSNAINIPKSNLSL